MNDSEQAASSGFSIAGLIGGTLGTIWWFVWQVIKGILLGIVFLLYDDGR